MCNNAPTTQALFIVLNSTAPPTFPLSPGHPTFYSFHLEFSPLFIWLLLPLFPCQPERRDLPMSSHVYLFGEIFLQFFSSWYPDIFFTENTTICNNFFVYLLAFCLLYWTHRSLWIILFTTLNPCQHSARHVTAVR